MNATCVTGIRLKHVKQLFDNISTPHTSFLQLKQSLSVKQNSFLFIRPQKAMNENLMNIYTKTITVITVCELENITFFHCVHLHNFYCFSGIDQISAII